MKPVFKSKSAAVMTPADSRSFVRDIGIALAGSLFVALSAQINVPMVPVPMTMQTFAVMLIALTLSPSIAAMTMLFYAIEVASGLPFRHGLQTGLMGPTAGYILGYIPAAFTVSFLARVKESRNLVLLAMAALAGEAILMFCGVVVLMRFVGLDVALSSGVYPFLVGDAVKMALAVVTSYMLYQRFGAHFRR